MNLYTRCFHDAFKVVRPLSSSLGTQPKPPRASTTLSSISDLPTKPKRPAGPWNRFVSEYKDVMRGTKLSESMKVLVDKWKNLSPDERAPYEAGFNQDNHLYKEQMVQYNKVMKQKIPMDQMMKIIKSETSKQGVKKERVKSGWNLFMKETILSGSIPFLQNGKADLAAVAKKWHSISESERQSFNQRARSL